MSVLYQNFEPELKFFGVMNGYSESHTNAFFFPDPETIVLIDLSALNMHKASRLLENCPNLKHIYACVTHNHYDHVQGLEMIAFSIRAFFPGILLTLIVDESIREETVAHLDTGGLKTIINHAGEEDKVYELYSFDQYGTAYSFYSKDGKALQQMLKPNWFVRTLPTTHSPRLKGSSGFAFMIHEKLVVFSGDTNQLGPYVAFLNDMFDHQDDRDNAQIEFYLDVTTRKNEFHLNFMDVCDELTKLLSSYPKAKIILMHYDDPVLLERQVERAMPGMLNNRVYLARELGL